MGWIDFWDGAPPIYVNDRHKAAHYRDIADGILVHVDGGRVLDYGCGEALNADAIAAAAEHLHLYDAAPSVRQGLATRFAADDSISVPDEGELDALAPGSIDLIVVNSVIQYLAEPDLDAAMGRWKRLLAPDGRLLLADVIPPDVGPVTDVKALLGFAVRERFLGAAMAGLVRTYFSNYRELRGKLGLTQMTETDVVGLLARHGFEARRVHPNIGHNQARMAFICTRPRQDDRAVAAQRQAERVDGRHKGASASP